MQANQFVHLHNHSTYSLLEALPTPDEIVARAVELGQTAVGLADKGYTYGLLEFYKAAHKKGLKPILGLETYVAVRSRHDKESGIDTKRYPLVLLAETNEGYKNLLQLATKAALEGMYYKPRVDMDLLALHSKGLIALTGPISGHIPQAALAEDGQRIIEFTKKFQTIFGKENLYYELMDLPNVTGQAEVNQQLIKWGTELGVPVVATCNAHYCRPEDGEAHDVLLCIQKNSLVTDPGRFSMRDTDFSMRPFAELEAAFAHVPEALTNTRVIADRCHVEVDFGTYQIPKFPTPNNVPEEDHLYTLATKGFEERYPKPTTVHTERLDYELKIIKQMGFPGYFLIVADFIAEAKRRGITVGPGRGSAAGSMVSYCLDITTIDPMEHGLLFERFLNPARVSMPDIDIDFADNRRDEVLEYVRQKYGNDRVVQICTFGTLAARAAVKDVGRAYGIPFLEMNTLAKLIPERPGTTLDEALETNEMKQAYDTSATYKQIIDIALKLEGKARHVSVHACGVIITPTPTVEFTALQHAPKDQNITITQYSAKPLEDQGLLKMDFLGLMNLTVIQTTLEIIERVTGQKIDIRTIPIDDADAFALLQRGETAGIFQLESGGMRRYLKQLKPTEFNDIMAMVALYRPGPMEVIPDYIKRKNNPKLVSYEVPELETFLKETYGIMVYQEQVQLVVQEFAGFTLGEGYLLIKGIAKKILSLLEEQREKFMAGAEKMGRNKKTAEKIFALIEPFAGYGFNKSHAASYARIAYETAYLKAKYPTEFMSALLSSDAQRTDRVMIEIEECRNMGIDVLPPDVNESLRHFTALPNRTRPDGTKGNAIRFGLSAIKGIGDSSVQELITAREAGSKFTSLEDFATRVPAKILNKKLFESLGKAGAFDSLVDRSTIVQHYDLVVEFAKSTNAVSSLQTDMFSQMEGDEHVAQIHFPEVSPVSELVRLNWEKETLGMYVSSHPLAGMKKYISKKAHLIGNFTRKNVGKNVTIAGMPESIKKIMTKKGETMAIVTLEDPTGKIEVTFFPRVFAECAGYIDQPDTMIIVAGTLDNRAGMLQLRAEAVKKASLDLMIAKAKEAGMYDEEAAKRGLNTKLATLDDEEEVIVALEEELLVHGAGEDTDEHIVDEVTTDQGEADEALPTQTQKPAVIATNDLPKADKKAVEPSAAVKKDSPVNNVPNLITHDAVSDGIYIYTLHLPSRAPKQLLMDIKQTLEQFPGSEKVQLQIGAQTISVPLSIAMSTIVEQKLTEIITSYSNL